jgi:SPP1 gp7 family putative phage head morphogenesis protein
MFEMAHLADEIADLLIRQNCTSEAYAALRNHLLENEYKQVGHQEYFDALFKALAPHEKWIKAMLHEIWEKERKVILANLKKLRKGYLKKDIIDNILYPRSEFIRELSTAAQALFVRMIKERGEYYMNQFHVDIAFDVTNPNVQAWLKDYVPKFSKDLEDVNERNLRFTLSEGMDAGESIPELMARVNETFESFDRYRAEIISRTESSRASNEAWIESAKQSGVVEKKEWMTAPGCCDICAEMDGEVVELEERFFDDDYGDGQSPPRHPNCRCAVAASFEETGE